VADAFQEARVGVEVTLKGAFLLAGGTAVDDCIVVLDSLWHNAAVWYETPAACLHGGFQSDDLDFSDQGTETSGSLIFARVGVMNESLQG
jgi:hypothetical protein